MSDTQAPAVASDALLDSDGCELAIGRTYKIASAPECTNRFKCVALHDPNGTMFVREHDGMVHLGREFIEYRNGVGYYNVSDTSNPAVGGRESSSVPCTGVVLPPDSENKAKGNSDELHLQRLEAKHRQDQRTHNPSNAPFRRTMAV